MSTGLLFKSEYTIGDITVNIPTVRDIIDNEELYYSIVSIFTLCPIDLMVELDDIGVDFTEINDYELFLMLFAGLRNKDCSLVFKNMNFDNFKLMSDEQNNSAYYYDEINNVKINKPIYLMLSSFFRTILGTEKDRRKPGNNEAKRYMLERARKKRSKRNNGSQLESLIVSLVNTEQFPYNFETVKDITIYQFNQSVTQIINKVDYDNRMIGVYTGNIPTKSLKQSDYNWLNTNK